MTWRTAARQAETRAAEAAHQAELAAARLRAAEADAQAKAQEVGAGGAQTARLLWVTYVAAFLQGSGHVFTRGCAHAHST